MRFRCSPPLSLSTLSAALLAALSLAAATAARPPVEEAATVTTASTSNTDLTGAANSPEPPTIEAQKIPELDAEKFWFTMKSGYWFVKHYSPQCGHCQRAAPIWQTLADFYITSVPPNDTPSSPKSNPDSPSANPSFTETYGWHFANLNCMAYGDICGIAELKIKAWPTFNLYKDGKLVDQFEEPEWSLGALSAFVEKHLNEIKPGSRPAKPNLPKVQAEDKKKSHILKESQKTDTTASEILDATKEAPKAAETTIPNPGGHSVDLDAAAFQRRITMTNDGWFIKFYMPWCGHCQAMAPAWTELGIEMKGLLNIGEVNCELNSRLCKDVKLRGYPTIMYFQSSEKVEYDGLRGFGDLASYAKKASDSNIKEVDLDKFETMEKQGKLEVAFLYFYDQATTSEDFEALERLKLNLIGHAPFLRTNSEALAKRFRVTTWPRLIVIRDGRPSYYNALAPPDLRDYHKMLSWMKSVWLPILPELSAANSHEIMNKRLVVLGVLSRNRNAEFASAKEELKKAAVEYMDHRKIEEKNEKQELRDKKQIRIEEAHDRNDNRALREAKRMKIVLPEKKDVGFAWVDGVFWERWIKTTYGVDVNLDGERIIINDQDNKQYWDTTLDDQPIPLSRSTILETLKYILASPPKIRSKSTAGRLEILLFQVRVSAGGHPWMILIGSASLIAMMTMWWKGKIWSRGTGGRLKIDGKDGLLGGAHAGGKFD